MLTASTYSTLLGTETRPLERCSDCRSCIPPSTFAASSLGDTDTPCCARLERGLVRPALFLFTSGSEE